MESNQIVLLGFVERLYAANDIDSLFSSLEWAVAQLGFEHVSYTYVPDLLNRLLGDLSPVFKLSQDYPTHFIDQYAASNFGEHDFTIKKILQGEQEPVRWWELVRELNSEEKFIIQVARQDYGLRQGITIPVFSDGASMAGVSITSGETDHLFNLLYHERIKTLTLISRMFSDRALQIPRNRAVFYAPFLNGLSATEKSVLSMLAEGIHLKTIASQLQLDYKYLANAVISSLRRKFGDLSRDQLMYQAGRIEFDKLIN